MRRKLRLVISSVALSILSMILQIVYFTFVFVIDVYFAMMFDIFD